jgi:hypothetical protein
LSLPIAEDLHNLLHFIFETDFKNTICFTAMESAHVSSIMANNDLLNDQLAKVFEDKAFSVLQVIQQTPSYAR